MSVSVSTVEASRPGGLTDAAAAIAERIGRLESVLDGQRRAVAELRAAWQGRAASAALTKAESNIDKQEALHARLMALRSALESGGSQLGSIRDGLVQVVSMLRTVGWTVAEDGTATPPLFLPLLNVMAPAFTMVIRRLLTLFASADKQTADAIHAAVGGPVPSAPPGTLGDPRQLPSDGADPEAVNRWWDSLSEAERNRMIAEHPPELGNLNGIPAEVRDQVNRAVMNEDLDRVQSVADRNGISTDEVIGNPDRYGLTQSDVTRYTNAVRTRDGLRETGGPERPDGTTLRPVMLWGYEPEAFNGEGGAAIAIGNPDAALNTAVVVPGTGSSVRDGWLTSTNATNLYDQMYKTNPDEPMSVIAWMGYDTPNSPTDPRIATPWLARSGADLLAADVNGLAATHEDGVASHVTVIGHSYGSTAVANAFAESGMSADDAILIGSPGTDLARNAADFNLDGGNVYVGASSSDPVTWLGQGGPLPDIINDRLNHPLGLEAGLGTDPAGDSYGSIRFDAEVPGRTGLNFEHHSRYYDVGSESLRAMTDIVIGDAASLEDKGLLAEGRRQIHVGLPDKVDLPGLPPIDLPDWDTRIPGTPALNDPEGDRPQGSITSDHQY